MLRNRSRNRDLLNLIVHRIDTNKKNRGKKEEMKYIYSN